MTRARRSQLLPAERHWPSGSVRSCAVSSTVGRDVRKCAGRRSPLLLEFAVLAAVEAVPVGLDSLFTLRGHSDPMLYRRVPVQIAVLDDLADFEKPRVIRRSWLCLTCRAHTALYPPSTDRHAKIEFANFPFTYPSGLRLCRPIPHEPPLSKTSKPPRPDGPMAHHSHDHVLGEVIVSLSVNSQTSGK